MKVRKEQEKKLFNVLQLCLIMLILLKRTSVSVLHHPLLSHDRNWRTNHTKRLCCHSSTKSFFWVKDISFWIFFSHFLYEDNVGKKKPSKMHLNWLVCRHRSVEQSQPIFAWGSVTTTNFEPLSMWDAQTWLKLPPQLYTLFIFHLYSPKSC